MDTSSLKSEPGWMGLFTRQQAEDAYQNGTRIVKVATEPDDVRRIGAKGTVIGSLNVPGRGTGYFIEWDAMPQSAVFVLAWKIGPHAAGPRK